MIFASTELLRARTLLGGELYSTKNDPQGFTSTGTFEEKLFGSRLLACSRYDQKKASKFRFRVGLVAICLLVIAVFTSSVGVLLALPLYLIAEKMILESSAQKRITDFDRDYTAFLLSLASSVKTGLDPLIAVTTAGKLFRTESEMCHAIERFEASLEKGDSEELAIRSFGDDLNHPDLRLFRTAFVLARKEGSSLAECLQRLARVTRQRQSFRRKIASALAMQKLSAIGIGGCAIIITIIQASGNPESFKAAFAHPMGVKLLSLGAFLICAGLFWMMRIAKARLM